MHRGILSTPTGTAALIAIAGIALALPLTLPSSAHESSGASLVDLVGRCVALAVVILLATRRAPAGVAIPAGFVEPNAAHRPRFEQALELELARLQRFARPFALVNIHCEGVAAARERDGQRAVTELLENAGGVIGASLRRTDFSAPLDDESFGILLPETDASTAGIVADQLRERLAQAMHARQWPATFSVGVSVFTRPVESLDTAVARVNELMSRVRQRGRNGMLIETDGIRQRDAAHEPA